MKLILIALTLIIFISNISSEEVSQDETVKHYNSPSYQLRRSGTKERTLFLRTLRNRGRNGIDYQKERSPDIFDSRDFIPFGTPAVNDEIHSKKYSYSYSKGQEASKKDETTAQSTTN
jgi:hypothetical protein